MTVIDKNLFNNLNKRGIEFHINADIKKYLTMGIGGTVKSVIIAKDKDELINIAETLTDEKYIILGGGSNIIFPENSPELFVIINKAKSIELIDKTRLLVASGTTNNALINWCKKNSYCGLEFLAGIPGTIGGATAVNAGAFGKSVSDVLLESKIFIRKEGIKKITNKDFGFKYRYSGFKYEKDIILDVILSVKKCNGKKLIADIDEILTKRLKNQPLYDKKTAGCYFKNPLIEGEKISAGKVIEEYGLKGKSFDNIFISDIHSNFLINTGDASLNNILAVEKEIKKQIKTKAGIELEREVIIVNSNGEKT